MRKPGTLRKNTFRKNTLWKSKSEENYLTGESARNAYASKKLKCNLQN